MHVQDATRKRRDELGRDDAHVAGQADQFDLVLLQLGDEGQVAFYRASSGDGDVMGSDPELPRRDQTRCIGLVRKHDGDLDAFESIRRDGRVDGEKVRPAPRQQNSDSFQRSNSSAVLVMCTMGSEAPFGNAMSICSTAL